MSSPRPNATALADRDANVPASPSKSLEYQREMLNAKLKDGRKDNPVNRALKSYISPSDNIQSPATQKLNAFKTKHAMKKSKPQTLFAKTSQKNVAVSNATTAMFGDIPNKCSSDSNPPDTTEKA